MSQIAHCRRMTEFSTDVVMSGLMLKLLVGLAKPQVSTNSGSLS